MASRIQPKTFLTPSIHAPARGSDGDPAGKRGEEEKRQAQPQREHEEEEKSERGVLRGGDEGEQPQHDRSHARGGDDAHEQSHRVGPGQPLPRAGLLHQRGRHPDVVEAEHRERERHEDERDPAEHPGGLERGAEEPAGERRGDAERGIRRGHSEHVDRGEKERAATLAMGLPAEEADGQRNHGVDARSQVEGEPPSEEQQQDGEEAAALQQIAEILRGARRAVVEPEPPRLRERDRASRQGRARCEGRRGRRRGIRRRARLRAKLHGGRCQALGVVAGLELDRARDRRARPAGPLQRHLDRELAPRRPKAASRRTRISAYGLRDTGALRSARRGSRPA